jgi:endothelin-converting enzyme
MYNQEGKLEQWWTNATSEGFKVKQECIVNQYAGMLMIVCVVRWC